MWSRLVRHGESVVIGPNIHDKQGNQTKEVKGAKQSSDHALMFSVKHTPGHTLGHVTYYLQHEKILFSGDCLFRMSCGRLFEGTPAQAAESLLSLRDSYPDDCAVYCAHEYTLMSTYFALDYIR